MLMVPMDMCQDLYTLHKEGNYLLMLVILMLAVLMAYSAHIEGLKWRFQY